ncbi:MAG TPA: hypothetical protein VJU02_01325 [Nitrospiraceae bacterium]|nr:hypothetical protein [Nitrospiraceae bacterium]
MMRQCAWYTFPMSFLLDFYRRTVPGNSLLRVQRSGYNLLAAAVFLTVLISALFPEGSLGRENGIFQQFTQHIGRQIHRDKQDFALANNCVSWFYTAKKTPRPAVQGISWSITPSSQTETDCHRSYPGGIDDARDDLAKTQALLSVSLTFYEFALVADQNDDAIYSPAEIRDLFRSLSLSYDDGDPTTKQVTALTERFDSWYHKRNMDALMQGMSDLYERGYRVTPSDRVELDRVMG